ncbi:MAG TPA: hypothetical protein VI643_00870 [Planctomycetota bacterium]|nr:hypothetical protein [Planctomycetota bacterium]
MAQQDEFNLIIERVDAQDLGGSSKRFADAFGLDAELTQAMLSKALPVLFVSKLTKKEVKAILPKLEELSTRGFEFRITTQSPKIARVNWLKRPDFTAANSGSNAVAFDWQDQAFVCPSCGEGFLFKRIGSAFGPSRPVVESEAAAPEPAVARATASAIPKITIRTPEPEYSPDSEDPPRAPEPAAVADLQLEGEDEEIQPPPPPPPPEIAGIEEEVIPLDDLPLAKQSTELEAPVVQQGPISAALDGDEEIAAVQPSSAGGAGGEVFNVFVPEVKDQVKREEVVKLISEIRACSPDEARKLTRRIMIPVAKNVPRDKAEKILSEFRRLKITGRMTKATRDE